MGVIVVISEIRKLLEKENATQKNVENRLFLWYDKIMKRGGFLMREKKDKPYIKSKLQTGIYHQYEKTIGKDNLGMYRLYNLAMLFVFFLLFAVRYGGKMYLSFRWVYLALSLSCLVELGLAKYFLPKHLKWMTPAIVWLATKCYLYGLFSGVFYLRYDAALTFPLLLLLIGSSFILPMFYMVFLQATWVTVFCFCTACWKPSLIAERDIYTAIAVCVLANILSYRMNMQRMTHLDTIGQLKLTEQKLETAMDTSDVYAWEYNVADHTVIEVVRYAKNLNIDDIMEDVPEAYLKRGVIHPCSVADYLALYQEIIEGNETGTRDIRYNTTDHTVLWLRVTYRTIFDEENQPVKAIFSGVNISAKKLIEKRYEDELKNYDLQSGNMSAYCKLNLTKNRVEDVRSTFSTKDDQQANSVDEFFQIACANMPDEREREEFKQLYSREKLLDNQNEGKLELEYEYRYELEEHEILYLRTKASIAKNPETDDIEVFLYIYDVTEKCIMELLANQLAVRNYNFVLLIDAQKDWYRMYACNNVNNIILPPDDGCYSNIAQLYIRQFALEETEKIQQQVSLSNITKMLQQNDTYSYVLDVRITDGSVHKKQLQYFYVDAERCNIVFTIADISDIFEKELQSKKQLEEALEKEHKATNAKQEFLAHMSHEMRTPLNGIKGMLDIMKEQERDENTLLDKALLSVQHLASIINDVLDMSKIESGKIELEHKLVHQEEVFSQVKAIVEPLAEKKKLNLTCELEWNGCEAVYSDAARLRQILLNIISNAIKYTDSGGMVKVVAIAKPETLHSVRIHYCVEDNGIGMKPEFLEKAFAPFEQEQREYANSGTGLGLPITQSLVKLMDGRMKIISERGQGTIVHIDLVCEGAEEELSKADNQLAKEQREHLEKIRFDGRHALVVEDNEINMEIAKMQLISLGLTVDETVDGAKALHMFQVSEEGTYDIIFMDIMMPNMDGLECSREIRKLAREDAKHIPIVAMTANAFAEDVNKSFRSGMNYHLTKPFEKIQIIEVMYQEFGEGRHA